MVQRHSRRVDCIQDITTNDNTKVRVKTVLIIPRRVGTSIKKAIRAKTLETTKSVVSNTDFEQFLRMVISGSLQQAIRTACKKICTVGAVEIRKSEVLGRGSKLPQMQPAELQPTPITEEPLAENPKTSS
jgi:ribosomal protein S3AE